MFDLRKKHGAKIELYSSSKIVSGMIYHDHVHDETFILSNCEELDGTHPRSEPSGEYEYSWIIPAACVVSERLFGLYLNRCGALYYRFQDGRNGPNTITFIAIRKATKRKVCAALQFDHNDVYLLSNVIDWNGHPFPGSVNANIKKQFRYCIFLSDKKYYKSRLKNYVEDITFFDKITKKKQLPKFSKENSLRRKFMSKFKANMVTVKGSKSIVADPDDIIKFMMENL